MGGAWPFLVRGVICLLNCVSNILFLQRVYKGVVQLQQTINSCVLNVWNVLYLAQLNATDVIASPC